MAFNPKVLAGTAPVPNGKEIGMRFDVQVIKVGEADVPGPEVYWMDKWREWITLNFHIVVIRNQELTARDQLGTTKAI